MDDDIESMDDEPRRREPGANMPMPNFDMSKGNCYAQPWLQQYFFGNQPSDKRIAAAICEGTNGKTKCPVYDECLAYATNPVYVYSLDGVWGGMCHHDRKRLVLPWYEEQVQKQKVRDKKRNGEAVKKYKAKKKAEKLAALQLVAE
jgi:hypothetical protein